MVSFSRKSEKENRRSSGESDRLLVLHNDDINTFEHVMETLCEVCSHDEIQAEQCALITHFVGKCEIKRGSWDDLYALKELLIKENLSVTIE